MGKLIITDYHHLLVAALWDGDKIVSLDAEPKEAAAGLGNIYVGKIEKIVPPLNAAFVEYQKGYTGFLPLEESADFIYLNEKKKNTPVAGDELLVQITKEPVRTKDAVLTARLCLVGKYNVVKYHTTGKIHVSSRIKNKNWKETLKEQLCLPARTDVTVRTESYGQDIAVIQAELDFLAGRLAEIADIGHYRTCYSLLERPDTFYTKYLKSAAGYGIDEVVTDDTTLFDEITAYQERNRFEVPVRFYQDKLLPLSVLYKVTSAVEETKNRKVWLKSGAFLVIDVTEAMIVIDVNSGKYDKKHGKDEMTFQINLEAAEEILRQLRLRCLSGIIMIDFINMEKEEIRDHFLEQFRKMAALEKHKTDVVEMTKLDLVEVTRKREKRPLYELLRNENY